MEGVYQIPETKQQEKNPENRAEKNKPQDRFQIIAFQRNQYSGFLLLVSGRLFKTLFLNQLLKP